MQGRREGARWEGDTACPWAPLPAAGAEGLLIKAPKPQRWVFKAPPTPLVGVRTQTPLFLSPRLMGVGSLWGTPWGNWEIPYLGSEMCPCPARSLGGASTSGQEAQPRADGAPALGQPGSENPLGVVPLDHIWRHGLIPQEHGSDPQWSKNGGSCGADRPSASSEQWKQRSRGDFISTSGLQHPNREDPERWVCWMGGHLGRNVMNLPSTQCPKICRLSPPSSRNLYLCSCVLQ